MDLFRSAERSMAMDDAVWERHANPWSVYSRFGMLPLLILAIWSRVWLGWWALAPVALVGFWVWYNPRAFPPPASTDNWASKGVFGERVFLNRREIPIPPHHQRAGNILTGVSAVGGILLVYGLVALDLPATLAGAAVSFVFKLWFVDRMVWLYEDMKDASPEYRSWLR